MAESVITKVLVLSDTHGKPLTSYPHEHIDVAIHCGDMTDESKLDEYRTVIELLKSLGSKLTLVIPGNHDFALDDKTFESMLTDLRRRERGVTDEDIGRTFGLPGAARALFDDPEVKAAGIVLLEPGTHRFILDNGATMNVYANPYTAGDGAGGFQYRPGEDNTQLWSIPRGIDVAITHGPPLGVLDRTASKQRAGSQSLFEAIAQAQPRLHCFGHIHAGWGAKEVEWREAYTGVPSHFNAIDHSRSSVVQTLATLDNKNVNQSQRCTAPPADHKQTLFVNAALESDTAEQHGAWMVELQLPRTSECPGI